MSPHRNPARSDHVSMAAPRMRLPKGHGNMQRVGSRWLPPVEELDISPALPLRLAERYREWPRRIGAEALEWYWDRRIRGPATAVNLRFARPPSATPYGVADLEQILPGEPDYSDSDDDHRMSLMRRVGHVYPSSSQAVKRRVTPLKASGKEEKGIQCSLQRDDSSSGDCPECHPPPWLEVVDGRLVVRGMKSPRRQECPDTGRSAPRQGGISLTARTLTFLPTADREGTQPGARRGKLKRTKRNTRRSARDAQASLAKATARRKEAMATSTRTDRGSSLRWDTSREGWTMPVWNGSEDLTQDLDTWIKKWKSLAKEKGYEGRLATTIFLELIQPLTVEKLRSRMPRELESIENLDILIQELRLLPEEEVYPRHLRGRATREERPRGSNEEGPPPPRSDEVVMEAEEMTPKEWQAERVWGHAFTARRW